MTGTLARRPGARRPRNVMGWCALACSVALGAACGSATTDEATPVSSVPPATTAAPATTTAATTVPATTSPATTAPAVPATTAPATTPPSTAAPTTAPPPTLPAEVPEGVLCIDIPPAAPVDLAGSPWTGLDGDPFGPLGAVPALELTFPTVRVGDWDDPPILHPGIVGGHLLVLADYPDPPGTDRGDRNDSLVALIRPDGGVAWQTCVPGTWQTVASGLDVDGVVMVDRDSDEQWRVELMTGEIVGVADVVTPAEPEPWSPPIRFGLPTESDLVAVDESDTEIWRDDTAFNPGGEGFYARVVGDVLLARVCLDGACEQQAIRAYGAADGTVLWTRPDHFGVPASGDGVALVNGIDAVVMVDLASGADVPGQRWDRPAFVEECCGGGDFAWVGRRGALVFDADYHVFRVWAPTALTAGTVARPMPAAG